MESFRSSCARFKDYPKNLIKCDTLHHTLQAYQQRLERQSGDLFELEGPGSVHFLQRYDASQGDSDLLSLDKSNKS